jgi:hypothetical protein
MLLLVVSAALTAFRAAAGQDGPAPEKAPLIDIEFDKATMRFGIVLAEENKHLTYDADGKTNNTCVKIDGQAHLFGSKRGRWETRELTMGKGPDKIRIGRRATYVYDDPKITITQTVETVRGEQTGNHDTCRVHYLLENKSPVAHDVGLRFLLDTMVGRNDGPPFIIPGENEVCETSKDFNEASKVPAFALALERLSLANPGVVAHLKLKLAAGVEAPSRVTFTAWPGGGDRENNQQGGAGAWEVPVASFDRTNDSAVALYWNEKKLPPGGKRELGFSYGLGNYSADKTGKLGMTLASTFLAGDELTVVALVQQPKVGQTVTLKLPKELSLVAGEATQKVPMPSPKSRSRMSVLTWQVRTTEPGITSVTVASSAGAERKQRIRINKKAELDK